MKVRAPRKPRKPRKKRVSRETWFGRYQQYLKSGHWRSLRAKSAKLWGEQCITCGTVQSLRYHHIRYGSNLRDRKPKDIVPMCERCHSDFHSACKMFSVPSKNIEPAEITEMVQYYRILLGTPNAPSFPSFLSPWHK